MIATSAAVSDARTRLPARTDANTYANRADTDAYARAIATTIVAGATIIAGAAIVAGCIAITTPISTLNDHASTAASAVALAILVADQSNIFDVVIGQHRKALR